MVELKTLRVELDAERKVAAAKITHMTLSEEKDVLENKVAETQREKGMLELRIEDARREMEADVVEMQCVRKGMQNMGKERQEEKEKLFANWKEILARKDRELAQVAAKVVNIEGSERRLQLDYEELQGERANLVAETTSMREIAKKAEKEAEERRTECEKVRVEIETVRLEMKRARSNHQDLLAKNERELAQAVANAVVLEGTGTFSIANDLNFDGEFSEVDSDRSSTWYGSEEQKTSPQSAKTSTISSTSRSLQYSTSGMHHSSVQKESDVVYKRVLALESALEKEKRTVQELRRQVTGLIETVAQKEEQASHLTSMAGKHLQFSRTRVRACPDLRPEIAPQQAASQKSTAPTPTLRPAERKKYE